MMFFKKGCAWWVALIISILTFLVGFLWGTAASSRTAGSPVAVVVDVPAPPTAPVVPNPPKVEPVKTEPVFQLPVSELPKAEFAPDPAPKVEPVDIEGISDEAWRSARVVSRPDGTIGGIILHIPSGSVVSFRLPEGSVANSESFKPATISKTTEQGLNIRKVGHSYTSDTNSLNVVALGAREEGRLILDQDSGNRFAYPTLGENGFGNLMFSFSTYQKFVNYDDKKLFVRLYIEWMALHPSRETNTDEAVDLLRWWNSHQSAK